MQKEEQGLIFSTNHTGYFHSHVLSTNCWPKENRHFRYLGVTWQDLTSLQFPPPLRLKHQNMLQWVLLSTGLAYARGQFVQWCVTASNNAEGAVQKSPAQSPDNPNFCKTLENYYGDVQGQQTIMLPFSATILNRRGWGKPLSQTTSNAMACTRSEF